MSELARDHVVTSRQLTYLMIGNTFPTAVLVLPSLLIPHEGKDALWSVAAASLYAIVPQLLVLFVLRRTRGRTLADVLRDRGVVGRLILIAFGLASIVALAPVWGSFAGIMAANLLPMTPSWAIIGCALVAVVYGAAGGLEVVARLSELLIPVGLLGSIGIFLMASPWFDFGRLLPLLPQHPGVLTAVAYQPFTYLGETAFACYLGGFVKDPDGAPRAVWISLIVNAALLFLLTAMPLLLFSEQHVMDFAQPLPAAIRTIHFGFLFERLDVLLEPAMVFFIAVKVLIRAVLGADMVADGLGKPWGIRIAQIGVAATALWSLMNLTNEFGVQDSLRLLWYDSSAPVMFLALLLAALFCLLRPHAASTA